MVNGESLDVQGFADQDGDGGGAGEVEGDGAAVGKKIFCPDEVAIGSNGFVVDDLIASTGSADTDILGGSRFDDEFIEELTVIDDKLPTGSGDGDGLTDLRGGFGFVDEAVEPVVEFLLGGLVADLEFSF